MLNLKGAEKVGGDIRAKLIHDTANSKLCLKFIFGPSWWLVKVLFMIVVANPMQSSKGGKISVLNGYLHN